MGVALMAMSSTSPRVQHVADGLTDTFVYEFRIFAATDLDVYLGESSTPVSTSDYDVTGVGNEAGGTVVFDTIPADELNVTIVRNIDKSRTTDFADGEFRAGSLNNEFDANIAGIQENQMNIGRCIRLGPSDADATLLLPSAEDRASTFLGFDADGNVTTSSSIGGGSGDVSSVFGRTGSVTAQSGDYDADKISETASRVFVSPTNKALLTTIAEATFLGRASGAGTGAAIALTATQARTALNVEDGADVTDATNVDAAGAVMNGDTSTTAMSFVSTNADFTVDTGKLVPRAQIKAYVDSAASTGISIAALDITSGGTAANNTRTLLTTATSTQTVDLPADAAVSQWAALTNTTEYAQTIEVDDTGAESVAGIPGESVVTSFTLPVGATVELARVASATQWQVVAFHPAYDFVTGALKTHTLLPQHDEGTVSTSFAPALSDGLLQFIDCGTDLALGLVTGDIPAVTTARLDLYVTATADILITPNASYVIDGANPPTFLENGDTALIQIELDGTNQHLVGPLSVPITTIAGTDVDLEPWDQTVYLTSTGVADLPDTRDLVRTTTIRVIRNGASGDRTMTKQYASDAFVGTATLASGANQIAFTAEPSASGGNWYSTAV